MIKNDLYPLMRLTIPLALTGLVQASVFFFETLFLARLSPDALAAGALVTWLFGTFAVILFGTLSSINILISHKYGANDSDGIALLVRDGFLLAILFSVPAIFLFWNMAPVFLIFGQSPAIVLLSETFLHALAWGILPNCILIAFLEFIIGLGHAKIVMVFSLLTVSLNIFFSFVFIFGKFGMPALGIAGAGWGMTISYLGTVIILAAYVLTNKSYRGYFHSIFNFKKPSFLLELLKVGVPIGVMYSFEVGFFFALTLLMGSLGVKVLAANQIVMQYLCALMSVIFAIAQAITVRMGHLLGAKEFKAAKRAAVTGFCMAGGFMSIIAICYWLFPVTLISVDFDVNNPKNLEIVHFAKQIFAIAAIFQILEGIRIALFGALRSLHDTNFTLLTSIISFWCIAFPMGYLFAIHLHFGGLGLWWGMVMGASVSMLLLYKRFKSKL